MPTRKIAPATEEAEGWEVQTAAPAALPAIEEDQETIIDRLRSLSGDERDRMSCKLYRRAADGRGLEYCQDYTVTEWEEGGIDRVRAEWGAGNYEVRIHAQGRKGVLYRDLFRIAHRVIATPAPAPAPTSELADVVRMLAEGQQRILEAVSQRPDPTAQLQSTLGLMASMREAMGLNTPPPPPPPASDPAAMLGQLVGAIKTLREVAAEVNPPAEPADDNPMSMLPKVLDLVKVGMSQQQPQALPAPHPPVQAMPIPASLQSTEDEDPMNILKLRKQLGDMIAIAARGEPAERGGEYAADNLPDELLPHLAREDFFGFLTMVHGGCKAHEPWFRAARDHCIKLLSEPEPVKAGGTD
jgi:hypothetical protein